jgi:putative ABC transport system permease protein
VLAAGANNTLPLSNLGSNTSMDVVGRPAPRPGEFLPVAYRIIGGDYFGALKIPLIAGRLFTDHDDSTSPPVVLLNQAAARRYFPGENPIGKRVHLWSGADTIQWTIVGVVGDTRGEALDTEATPEVSCPFRQCAEPIFTLAVRTKGDPYATLPAIQAALRTVDPDLGFFAIRTMDELMASTLAQRRFNLWLLGGFAATALVLAAIGLYGVISYSLAQRTREIGIRVALGANPGSVLRLLVGEGLSLAGVGVVLGLGASLVVTRVLASQLYGVGAFDPVTFGAVALLLVVVAALATYLPARRATGVDPAIALHTE